MSHSYISDTQIHDDEHSFIKHHIPCVKRGKLDDTSQASLRFLSHHETKFPDIGPEHAPIGAAIPLYLPLIDHFCLKDYLRLFKSTFLDFL